MISAFLAFVTLLGMLPPAIAFAVDATEPQADSDGVYQIGTAEDLLWFQQQVSNGNTTANAVLTADIDLSTVCGKTAGSWTAIPAYGGTFDGQGHKISNLYISGATVAKQGLFAELSATGVIQNVGLSYSSVSMTSEKKVNNPYAAILVGYNDKGQIINCHVDDSSVVTNTTLMAKSGAICGNDNGGKIINCYSINNTITELNNKHQIGGICGYSKGTIENCYVVNTLLTTTSTNAAVQSICGASTSATVINCYYSVVGKSDDKATAKTDEWFKSDDAIAALGSKYFAKDTENINDGYPILTFAKYGVEKELLEQALSEALPAPENYYTEDDRWNGVGTSINGFWADMYAIIQPARDVFDSENATQGDIDNAVAYLTSEETKATLQAAIDKLIPTTQVNATGLYEAIQAANSLTEETYTPVSWSTMTKEREKAQDLLESYFGEDGEPTEANTAGAQETADGQAQALRDAVAALDTVYNPQEYGVTNIQIAYDGMEALLEQFPQVDATAKAETQVWLDKGRPADGAVVGVSESENWAAAYNALFDACYATRTADGTATLHVTDNFGLLYPGASVNALTGQYTVTAGRSLDAILTDTLGSGYYAALRSGTTTAEYLGIAVYVNGQFLFRMTRDSARNAAVTSLSALPYIYIQGGDEVVIAVMNMPTVPTMLGFPTSAALADEIGNIRYATVTGPSEGKSGAALDFRAEYATAAIGQGAARSLSGATVWLTPAQESEKAALRAAITEDTGVVTGTDGSFTLTLASASGVSEGWYRMRLTVPGESGGLTNGPEYLIHVTDPDDLAGLKAAALAELESIRNAYGDDFYTTEQLEQVNTLAGTGRSGIESATTSGQIQQALTQAKAGISAIQTENVSAMTRNLNNLRKAMAYLPNLTDAQAGKLYKADVVTLEYLFGAEGLYNVEMTAYQRSQLRQDELRLLEYLQSRYQETNKGADLPDMPEFTVSMVVRNYYTDEVIYEASEAPWYFEKSPANIVKTIYYDKAGTINNPDNWGPYGKALDSYDGILTGNVVHLPADVAYYVDVHPVFSTCTTKDNLYDGRYYWPEEAQTRTEWTATDYYATGTPFNLIYPTFYMPRDNVVVTYYLVPVDGLAPADAAKAELTAAYQSYSKSDYTAEDWQTLTNAYHTGLTNIDAAAGEIAIIAAKDAAIAAMDAVPVRGETLGKVRVVVENSTYSGANGKLQGQFVAVDVDLTANTTMMTAVLAALQAQGYGWTGTGGTTSSGTDITYISGIYWDANENGVWDNDEPMLQERDGGAESGWMGTLNDWFTNEGFQSFKVSSSNSNYRITDGDVISVQYSSAGLGADLGGSWGNSDTSLKSLELTGGTLSPAFDSDVTEYALTLGSEPVSLMTTAANKNYQVRIFLNQKNTASEAEYYRRGEGIPVQAGDVIYVGVGERAWPSMNNQGAEAIAYTGTWYTIRVYDDGAEGIQARIDALPAKSKITYSNYQTYQPTVQALLADYEALDDKTGVDTTRLTEVSTQIQFFANIDRVKAQITALPTAAEIKADPETYRDQVEEAKAAYEALGIEGQLYLTSAEVAKLTQAVEALGESISQDDVVAVQAFNSLVAAIGDKVAATDEAEAAILAARTTYDNLTPTQKDLVTSAPDSYNTLCNAEVALPVVKQIAAIGEVTLESETAITEARSAYTAYHGQFPEKNMVSNLSVLEAAEAALKALQEGGGDTSGYQTVMDEVLLYLSQQLTSPIVGSTNGEWAVLAQARAGTLSSSARTNYLANLRSYVQQRNGKLDQTTDQTLHTEYARVVLALAALGEDPEHFTVGSTTYDLVTPLLDTGKSYAYQVSEQGNNGTIWALIALDSAGYRKDVEGNAARKAWIDLLIDKQQADGNWPIYNPDQVDTGSGSDLGGVDVCAMALQALAPYYLDQSRFAALNTVHTYADLESTVEKALNFLSSSQNSTGGYGNAEASAQVIVALATLRKDASTFAKNGISVLADLLSYETEEHGFSHTSNGPTNQMSTEQAAYALVAYDRYQKKQAPLYDMSDVSGVTEQFHTVEATAGSGGQITPSGQTQVKHNGSITFTITPDDGYQVQDIQVDGQSVWAGASALLANVAAVANDALARAPEEEQTCAEGAHIGEPIKIGERAATCTEPGYTGDIFCSSCGAVLEYGTQTGLVPHQYGNSWQSDAAGHWQVCLICGAESTLEPHEFTTISDDSLLVPDTDGYDLQQDGTDEDDLRQDGTDGEDLQQGGTDEDNLQQGGTDEDDLQQDGTDGDDLQQDGAGGDGVTSVIGIAPILFQSLGSSNAQSVLVDGAAQVCSVCGYETGASEESICSHTGGTATCTTKAVCTDCGLPYGSCAEHVYSQWDYSNNIHWLKCAGCGLEDTTSVAIHEWALSEQLSTENERVYVCVDCGAERTETAAVSMPMLANAVLTSANSTNVQTYTLETVTKDHSVYVTFEKLSPVIEQEVQQSGGTQTAVVTADAITEAVKAVTETSASSIVIRPTQVSESISAVNVQLPAGAVGTIVNAGANVELETAKGNVTLPYNALSSIQSQGGSTAPLVICVEEKSSSEIASQVPNGTELTDSVAVKVTVMAGNSEVTTFGGAQLTVMIPVDGKFTAGQQYEVLVISSNGTIEYLTGKCGTSGSQRYVTVKVNHLSTFVVLADTSVQQSYTITATAGAGGTISPYGAVEVQAGQSRTFRITPKNGYMVADVLVDWKSVGAVESYTFRSVDEDHEIRATFRRGTEIPDFGAVVGSIYISVENNTYRGGDFRGTLVSGWYDLCARDTMMTSVLKALALSGYSWWGTGASDTGGYDITYLAGIYVDENGNGRYDSGEPSLAEFDGARGAGWMGTLNDWFVNEGLQSFRASGSGSYELADGDYLNIVYTCNLGEDVGSLWGNTDTSLAALRISGGTLRPSFDGDTHEYSLSISGNSARITVTPTAVNKNYLVKTFLNHYDRDSAYYKRTQSITVKPGDVLYIGVGEPSWPSMNNQGAEAVDYQATKYIITVVNSNNADVVIEMIKALPEITYANYKTQAAKVAAARAAYYALSSDAKAKVSQTLLDKLEEAEAKVKSYEQIDDVKELLRALPKVDRGSTSSTRLIRQVKEAAAAYEKLNEEQKAYITAEDAGRYEALRLWLIETGAVKPDELPVIDGNFIMPELDGIEILLEPKATVDSKGNATASVTSTEFAPLLDEAAEAGATLIVIAPAGAEQASSISVKLPCRSLNVVVDETDAELAVRTHLGETNIPNSTLAKILKEANGQDLVIRVEEHPASEARTLLANKADIPADRLEGASVTEVTITSGSKPITSFGGHAITLLLPVSEGRFQTGKRCVVYQISESGAVDELTGLCRRQNNQLWVEVTTTHLSTFVAVPPIRLPFTDVKESDWFYDAVVYAYTNELFNGTSATTFSPNSTMTRAMLVTVLWRLEGTPAAGSASTFADVEPGSWYTDAVAWASSVGIVNGTSATTFDPNGSVTREQIAAILYRYAKTKGWNVNGASSLNVFADGSQVSEWAVRSMEWTYAKGLITSKDAGRLDPRGQASRAEVATILMRLSENRS